jgi:hypothetical protein
MCNSANSNPTAAARMVAEALIPNLPAPVAPDTVALDPTSAARIAGVYRSARTYEPLYVGVAGPGGGRGGATVRKLGDGSLMIGATRTVVSTGPDGRPTGLRQFPTSGDTMDFTYAGASTWTPNAPELASFTGQYRSDEIRATWTARVDSGRLVLSARRGSRQVLTPVYKDAFTGGGLGTIWFSRDTRGQVEAMHVSAARLWNLTLPKVATGTR